MMRFRFTPHADRDLDELTQYLLQLPAGPAMKIGKALQRTIRNIQLFPAMGRIDETQKKLARQNVFRVISGDYIVFYSLEAQSIVILGILHGKRDLKSMMALRQRHP